MRAFTRRALLLIAVALLAGLAACATSRVGEEQAREAGLALINQAFGVNAMDAHVEYFERAGTSVLDNMEVRPGSGTPIQIYLVTISDPVRDMDLYYAEVDAKTGVAYYALKNEWLVDLLNDSPSDDASATSPAPGAADSQNGDAQETASVFMPQRMQKEVALVSKNGCCRRGQGCASYTGFGYFATLADGALYRIGLSSPAPERNKADAQTVQPKGERP